LWGDTSAPPTWGSFAGFGIGSPDGLKPSDQFADGRYWLDSTFSPVTRSSRKNMPFRLAWASSFRRWPLTTASISTGVWVASQSCVS
jgi:hypothetical protein